MHNYFPMSRGYDVHLDLQEPNRYRHFLEGALQPYTRKQDPDFEVAEDKPEIPVGTVLRCKQDAVPFDAGDCYEVLANDELGGLPLLVCGPDKKKWHTKWHPEYWEVAEDEPNLRVGMRVVRTGWSISGVKRGNIYTIKKLHPSKRFAWKFDIDGDDGRGLFTLSWHPELWSIVGDAKAPPIDQPFQGPNKDIPALKTRVMMAGGNEYHGKIGTVDKIGERFYEVSLDHPGAKYFVARHEFVPLRSCEKCTANTGECPAGMAADGSRNNRHHYCDHYEEAPF